MDLKHIIGQNALQEHLKLRYLHKKISHSMLFIGKEGQGALPLSITLAQCILCERNSTNADNDIPCYQCQSCKKVIHCNHPDLHYIYPIIANKNKGQGLSRYYIKEWHQFLKRNPYGNVSDWLNVLNAENKQGNITSEECQEIIRQCHLKPYEANNKIFIIWMPEYLGKEGNKLLKLIEEPPCDTILIFVTENENLLLTTLLSRLQKIVLHPLSEEDIANELINNKGLDPEKAHSLAILSEGNYRLALQLVKEPETPFLALSQQFLNTLFSNKTSASIMTLDTLTTLSKANMQQFLNYIICLLGAAFKRYHIMSIPNQNNTTQPLDSFTTKIMQHISLIQLDALIHELEEHRYAFESNAHIKLLWHSLIIKLKYIIKNNAITSFK